MNRIIKYISLLLLFLFSIYYTNNSINILRNADPIMKEIKENSYKYKVDSVDAIINGDYIIPGKKGKDVNYLDSYSKMKKYGAYNESFTILEDIKPMISIYNNYDKYIISGNKNNKNISFVFVLDKEINIDKLLSILNKNNIKSTFFIDGKLLENNTHLIKNISNNNEINILSYNGEYDESLFMTSVSFLESITKKKSKYCYSEEENSKLLEICSNNYLHTIIPTLVIYNNMYREIEKNLNNSMIFSIKINSNNLSQLSSTINYIISKGYSFVTIDELVSE